MNISIGNNIKTARKKIGFTQDELAYQLGVTAQAVSRWESGSGMPDISMVIPICQALSISTDTLFGITEQPLDNINYLEVKHKMESMKDGIYNPKNAIDICNFLIQEIEKEPFNYGIQSLLVERAAHLSRFYEQLIKENPDEWNRICDIAIRKGAQIIRYCNEKEIIEKTQFALAWIYIQKKEFDGAREHISTLPSVSSNRLQESILAQLAMIENGFEAEKKVLFRNLQNFVRAFNKEMIYAMADYPWHATYEETVTFGNWMIKVMDVFGEMTELITACRGFTRDCHMYLMSAHINAKKYEECGAQFDKLKADMDRHYEFYQTVLENEDEQKKYTADALRYMQAYTKEFIEKKQADIVNQLRGWHGDEVDKVFGEE